MIDTVEAHTKQGFLHSKMLGHMVALGGLMFSHMIYLNNERNPSSYRNKNSAMELSGQHDL